MGEEDFHRARQRFELCCGSNPKVGEALMLRCRRGPWLFVVASVFTFFAWALLLIASPFRSHFGERTRHSCGINSSLVATNHVRADVSRFCSQHIYADFARQSYATDQKRGGISGPA